MADNEHLYKNEQLLIELLIFFCLSAAYGFISRAYSSFMPSEAPF